MLDMDDRRQTSTAPDSFRQLVSADFHRIGLRSPRSIALALLLTSGPHQYIFWMRLCERLSRGSMLLRPAFVLSRLVLRRHQYRYGIDIPYNTRIGPGLYIGHGFGVVINHEAVIGSNCNLSHGVTIGQANRGKRAGTALIGNGVYFGPGVVVVGKVTIGDDVAVGANAVVLEDVPNSAVVVGNPGRVVSLEGSYGYVENAW